MRLIARSTLVAFIDGPGGKDRAAVKAALGRRRPLALAMIRRLNRELGIPAGVLIRPIRVAA